MAEVKSKKKTGGDGVGGGGGGSLTVMEMRCHGGVLVEDDMNELTLAT